MHLINEKYVFHVRSAHKMIQIERKKSYLPLHQAWKLYIKEMKSMQFIFRKGEKKKREGRKINVEGKAKEILYDLGGGRWACRS